MNRFVAVRRPSGLSRASRRACKRGLAALAAACMLGAASVRAADDAPPAPSASRMAADPLGPARAHIAAQRWADAIAALRRASAPTSADWNNLMGFSLRKQAKPDLDAAQRHYDAALQIDPMHKGALEYAGELALMKGDAQTARRHLATLERVCPSGCEERSDLQKAVQQFEAGARR